MLAGAAEGDVLIVDPATISDLPAGSNHNDLRRYRRAGGFDQGVLGVDHRRVITVVVFGEVFGDGFVRQRGVDVIQGARGLTFVGFANAAHFLGVPPGRLITPSALPSAHAPFGHSI